MESVGGSNSKEKKGKKMFKSEMKMKIGEISDEGGN